MNPLPKKFLILAFIPFLLSRVGADDFEKIIIPDFEIVGSQLMPILNASFDQKSALAFRCEDAMKEGFTEAIAAAKYGAFIYYNRAIQVSHANGGGGFLGDFVDKAHAKLGSQIRGYAIPIRDSKDMRSPMSANNVLNTYFQTIKENKGYDIVFIVEYSLRKTIEKTELFKNKQAHFAFVPHHYDGLTLARQSKFYEKFGSAYNPSIAMPIDLRHSDYQGAGVLAEYSSAISDHPKLVLFTNSQTSFNALADYIALQNAGG
ncbi:hypothetical protein [Pelagicoccus albus]|uniref:Uncharacterized protein n=1 Tax=Pelagicoccus albus TaxID=415222 RepID=A0A7X1B6N2_9BACT|nr:hypothetical protein [Pelagicoccus albus]MBC2606668.1 hypothetical protein [Pelagicoccus albus]